MQKLIRTTYNDNGTETVVLSNIRKKRSSIPVYGVNENYTATKVTTWYDGTPMTPEKADGSVYLQLKNTEEYFRINLPNWGETFLEKNTMAEMRGLSLVELLLLKSGYYKGVGLSGYYKEGDTPGRIEYYISSTTSTDNGGSVIEVGGIKLEHKFVGELNIKYFGAKNDGVHDDLDAWQRVISSDFTGIIKFKGILLSTDTLSFKSNIFLVGDSEDNSIVYFKDYSAKSLAFNNYMIDVFRCDNVGIRNLTVGLGTQTSINTRTSGIALRDSRNIKISNVTIQNAKTYNAGVWSGGYGILSWAGAPDVTDGGADNVDINNITFKNNGQSDLALFNGQIWNISNCRSFDTGFMPINIEGETNARFIRRINLNQWVANNSGYALISTIENVNSGIVEDINISNVIGYNVANLAPGTSGALRVRGTNRVTLNNIKINETKQEGLLVTVDSGKPVNNLTVNNLSINNPQTTGRYAVSIRGDNANKVNNLVLNDIRVNNAVSIPFYLEYVSNARIENCHSTILSGANRTLELRNSNKVYLVSCSGGGSSAYGANIQSSTYVTLLNCEYYNNGSRGIQLQGDSDHVSIMSCKSYDDRITKTQSFGIFIETTITSPNIIITGGDYKDNITKGVSYASSIDLSNVIMTSNLGDSVVTLPSKVINSNYLLKVTDATIICDNLTNITLSLPAVRTVEGKKFSIKKYSTSDYSVTVTPNSSDLIDGDSSVVLNDINSKLIIESQNGRWVVL